MDGKPNWPVLALIFVSVCAIFIVVDRMGWLKRSLPGICYDLYWPESTHREWVLSNKYTRRIPEHPIGSGSAAFARTQVTPEAWAAAQGLEEAASWPDVVFRLSGGEIYREEARIIRAQSGRRMGLWIFGGIDKAGRATTFIGHPGGNSTTPFETIFVIQGNSDMVLNVLRHRPDRRLETFVFRPNQDEAICSGISGL